MGIVGAGREEEMDEDGEREAGKEQVVLMWGDLSGVSPQCSPLLGPVPVRLPPAAAGTGWSGRVRRFRQKRGGARCPRQGGEQQWLRDGSTEIGIVNGARCNGHKPSLMYLTLMIFSSVR